MSITCLNEDGSIHDFDSEFTRFLDCKIGDYDGGFDSIEQFESYLVKKENIMRFNGVNPLDVRVTDINTVYEVELLIQRLLNNEFNYRKGSLSVCNLRSKPTVKLLAFRKLRLRLLNERG